MHNTETTGVKAVLTALRVEEYVRLLGSGGEIGRGFEDERVEKLNGRTIEEIAREQVNSHNVYALRTFKRLEGMTRVNGQEVLVTSTEFDHSGKYFLGGTVLTREQVAASEEMRYVLYNMDKHFHSQHVVKHRFGSQWYGFYPEKGDVVLTV